jgi:SET domain
MVKYFHFHNTVTGQNFDGKLVSDQCEHMMNGIRCKKRCQIGLGICWIHLLSKHHLRIKASKIENAGMGLFVIDKSKDVDEIIFRPNQKICSYNGEILELDTHLERYGEESAPYTAQLHKKENIQIYEDASLHRGVGSLINHSNKSDNCKMSIRKNNTIVITATKNIRNNSEILLNYGTTYRFNSRNTKTATNYKRFTI